MDTRMPTDVKVEILLDDSPSPIEYEGDVGMNMESDNESLPNLSDEAWLFRRAKSYQRYMSLIPIPTNRGTVLPCDTWWDLGNSLKKIYQQPLHYLTNIHIKKLDQARLGAGSEHLPLYMTVHAAKAEASIWILEEVHRKTTSPEHLFMLWRADSNYHRFIDPIFPKLDLDL